MERRVLHGKRTISRKILGNEISTDNGQLDPAGGQVESVHAPVVLVDFKRGPGHRECPIGLEDQLLDGQGRRRLGR